MHLALFIDWAIDGSRARHRDALAVMFSVHEPYWSGLGPARAVAATIARTHAERAVTSSSVHLSARAARMRASTHVALTSADDDQISRWYTIVAMNRDEKAPTTDFARLRSDFTRFMMGYKFGIDELMTKINILKEEFTHIHRYSPIEHVGSRLKTPDSIITKARRKNCPLTLDDIRANIVDIAGIRITCSFISDTYRIADMIGSQTDVRVVEIKDYIAKPKPNGYKSLHLIVEIPVFMSDRMQPIPVELQIRTIAMDFWASLEHKIFYKYDGTIPAPLLEELTEAATSANRLDITMERLHDEVAEHKGDESDEAIHLNSLPPLALPRELLTAMLDSARHL